MLDLDGVVWLADQPIRGAAAAVGRLQAAGQRVLFVTNNSYFTVGEQRTKLASFGVEADDHIVTSAVAAAALVEGGSTALVCGGPGVEEALAERGVRTVRDGRADVVVVGWHRDFDYERLTAAYRAIAGGARFIATNDDATYPTPAGPIPGGGAIVAAIATAAGEAPVIAGKPHGPMAEIIRARVGDEPGTVVGDRPSTDGELARRLAMRFALVLSGVTREADLPVSPAPDLLAADLAELVDRPAG